MKAYELESIGNLCYIDKDLPSLKNDWCLVKVVSTGICSSDIPRIYVKGTYSFPTIPGHEFSGTVVDVYDDCNKSLIGCNVGVFPLIPCHDCEYCKQGNYEICEHYDYIGSRRDGSFAEYVAVPIWNLIKLPKNISSKEAALLEPVSVALHAVKKGNIAKVHDVAIVGTGMIGFVAAQWAHAFGAKSVTIIGRNTNKKTIANNFDFLNFEIENKVNKLFDVVIEAVGTPESINKSIMIAKPNGKIVFMGNPSGEIMFSQNVYWRILRKQLTIEGTWNSSYEFDSFSDWTESCEAIGKKIINVSPLITHVFEKEELVKGLLIMKNHSENFCKIIVNMC